jgi:hypothetical protein
MGRYTEIKKFRDNDIAADYRIFDTGGTPMTFFIRVIRPKKIMLCSINEDLSNPFYQLDLSDPNYKNIPLSQKTVSQHMFIRGIAKIAKAFESGNLPDELSICN